MSRQSFSLGALAGSSTGYGGYGYGVALLCVIQKMIVFIVNYID